MSTAQTISRYADTYRKATAKQSVEKRPMIPYHRVERTRASGWPDNMLTLPRRYAIGLEHLCYHGGPRAPRNVQDLIDVIAAGRDKDGLAERTLEYFGRMYIELMKYDGEWDSGHESNKADNLEDAVAGQWYLDVENHWPHLVQHVQWWDAESVLSGDKHTDVAREAHIAKLATVPRIRDARQHMENLRTKTWAEVELDFAKPKASEPEMTLEEELASLGVVDRTTWGAVNSDTRRALIKRHGIKGNIGNATKVLIERFGWETSAKADKGGEA